MKKATKFKRIISGVLSAVMTVSAVPIVSANAEESIEPYPYTMFAASNSDGAITINTDNVCINGSIATNGTIVTASPNFNVNGTKTENANEEMIYIQKKLNYSYFSGDNVEMYADDYILEEQNININNPMDVNGTLEMTGNINMNSGIKALEDVNLNGEVKNTNNSVIFSETGDININTSNTNFNGLIYAPYGDIVIDTDNLNLNNVVIIGQTITLDCPSINANYSTYMAELVGTESDIDVEIYAMGEYNSEANSIDIEWYTNYENSSYEIWISDDNEEYTSVGVVSDGTAYQYPITEDFEKRYFKISLTTNYGEYIESVPFVVTKTEKGYFVDFLDSDEDGLPDIYEIMIGTDVSVPDTDNDGLTDYQEVYITGTDPTKFDSVTEGVSDADADSDGDGLSNAQEIDFGTDPQLSDTDGDNLSDYDEINVYGTDPLNPDTDDDDINDGDEIVLGLNPLKPDTDDNGVLDGDEYFEQTVNLSRFDNDLFENNLAVPSLLTVSAKGNVNNNIDISEYTGYLKGDEREYGGKVIEITNSEINSGILSFTLSDDYNVMEYEIGDITTNGLLICYNDGEDTTPLETDYDVETRTLSAEIDSSGIYFVLDVISWLDSYDINIQSDKTTENTSYVKYASKNVRSSTAISTVTIKGQVDIVFVIDTTGSMGSYITNVKNNINDFVDEIESAGITPSFALVDYKDVTSDGQHSTNTKKNHDGRNWFKDANEFKAQISNLNIGGGGDEPESAIDALEMARQLDLRTSSQKFFILVTDAGYKIENNYGITSVGEMIDLLVDDKINVSVVSNSSCELIYEPFYIATGGVFANVNGNFKDELLSIADMINEEANSGCWIALNGLVPQIVKLDEKPVINGTADTDRDTLLDIEELNSIEPTKVKSVTNFLYLLGLPTDYNYPTIPYYDYKSNPILKDTDGDFDRDDVDPFPRKYQLNGRLIANLQELDALAVKFAQNRGMSSDDYRTNVSDWLVFMFIRHYNKNYVNDKWNGTGGPIDIDFIAYVNELNRSLYTYFEDNKDYIATAKGDVGDLYHLAATATGYIYESNFDYGIQFGLMPEYHINNLSGWAGDLQTAMNNAMVITNKSKDYDVFKSAMQDIIGYDSKVSDVFWNSNYEHSFDIDDVYADTDAYNIQLLLIDGFSINDAFASYFDTGLLKRFTTFTNGFSRDKVSELTYIYTDNKYMGLKRWPLFKYDFNTTQSEAARDAFVDFIFTRISYE